jgi:hypothetical protein
MLAWRTIAAPDVTAFGASAQMQPPSLRCQAFDATCAAWFRVQINSFSFALHPCLFATLLRIKPHFEESLAARTRGVTCFNSRKSNPTRPCASRPSTKACRKQKRKPRRQTPDTSPSKRHKLNRRRLPPCQSPQRPSALGAVALGKRIFHHSPKLLPLESEGHPRTHYT